MEASSISSFLRIPHLPIVPFQDYQNLLLNKTYQIPYFHGYMDNTGKWYSFEEESKYEDLLNQYRMIQYAIYCDGLEPK